MWMRGVVMLIHQVWLPAVSGSGYDFVTNFSKSFRRKLFEGMKSNGQMHRRFLNGRIEPGKLLQQIKSKSGTRNSSIYIWVVGNMNAIRLLLFDFLFVVAHSPSHVLARQDSYNHVVMLVIVFRITASSSSILT
ncbi:hypothetical protein GCM10027577_34200 [Spirosoma fluminis]